MEVGLGLRPAPLARCPQARTGRLGLGRSEAAAALRGPRGPWACGAPSRVTPARAGLPSSCRGWRLGGLGEVPAARQQRGPWGSG